MQSEGGLKGKDPYHVATGPQGPDRSPDLAPLDILFCGQGYCEFRQSLKVKSR